MSYLETGLTASQVQANLKKHGYNEIPKKKEFTALKILVSQFSSFLVIILIIAGAVSIALHEYIDGMAIFGIVIINAVIGFFQEYKAENAVKALQKMVVPTAIVLRDGEETEIPIKEIVPDDIIILSEGEKIPADCEIIEAFSLKVDESMLTGESVPVVKKAALEGEAADKDNQLFKGTLITTGRAKAKATHTGLKTEFGKIINLVSKNTKTRSPLTLQLDELAKKVGIVTLSLVVILFILGYLRGISLLEMLMISVALGVSAIPEGMPIIVTLTLAMGVQILARHKAIVRKMNSIETLGATTVICSDKTGTLTLNEMTVKVVNTNFSETEIEGIGYDYKKNKAKLETVEQKKLMEICENCNNSFIGKNIIGDPTEIALKILNRKAGFKEQYKRLDENVFTSERKMMSTLVQIGKKKEVMAKGAHEEILKLCTHILKDGKVQKLSKTDIAHINTLAKEYSSRALRVLGFAYAPYEKALKKGGGFEENDLIFVGLVGMIDPPRKTVKKSIQTAQEAHIKVKIITGDNAITAMAVGEQIGLQVHNTITGSEIEKMNDKQLYKVIEETEIFARTKPEHKYRIVDLLKKHHEVVAVTGDGVNDAPALKHADVGVAMGIKGTEATKEVADIVLKDDNFSTIVNTIKEGRRIYHNILSFIKFMLSANFDTITAVGVLTLLGMPLPILPLQVLWINIATDAFPALALGRSEATEGIMKEKPHPKRENIFKKFMFFIFSSALYQTIANIVVFFYGMRVDKALGIDTAILAEPSHARTMVFTQIVISELIFVFMCRDEEEFKLRDIFSNRSLIIAVLMSFGLQLFMIYSPFMQSVFKTVPLQLHEIGFIALCSSTVFLVPGTTRLLKKVFKVR